jgi:hypothetical protein
MKQKMDTNTYEIWYEEIEQLEVNGEERELFLRLLATLREGAKEEARSLLDEAMLLHSLSRLTLLRELHAHLK